MGTSITFNFAWQPVDNAQRYDIFQYNLATALSSLLGSAASSVAGTGVTVDETATSVFQVRGWDGVAYSTAQTFFRGRPNILAALRQEIRVELKDTDASQYRWSDDELNQYIREAILDFSRYFPLEQVTSITTTGQVSTYDLTGAVTFSDVVYVQGSMRYHLKPMSWKGGEAERTALSGMEKLSVVRTGSRLYAGHYDYRENQLSLDFDPGDGNTLEVHYGGSHTVPVIDTGTLSVPLLDQEIISLYVQGKAWMRVGGQDASLSRWDETGNRADSPIVPRETRLFNAYAQKIRDRKGRPRTIRLVRVH